MLNSAYDMVKKIESIVSLPSVFIKIDNLINDPDCNLTDIADIISEDPGLSARLLKISNSAMFNFPAEINSITRAITVIGTKQLRDLVLATKVISVFKEIDAGTVDMKTFWMHSIATGIMARLIASYRREENIEYYYLLGLLHDVGRLIMYTEQPELSAQAHRHSIENNVPLHMSELTVFGFDHSAVGSELMKMWNLPQAMYEAIYYHHRPSLALSSSKDAPILHIADIIINALSLGGRVQSEVPPLDESAWEALDLSRYILPEAVEQLDVQLAEITKLFLEEA